MSAAPRSFSSSAEGDATPAPDGMAQLDWFATETRRIIDLLATLFPEVYPLSDAETLTYLHGTISDKRHFVAAPSVPAHLDALLSDTPFLGGLEPKLGEKHLRVLTVPGFPNTTAPGLLDALNDLGFAYRWSTRWIALDKIAGTKQLTTPAPAVVRQAQIHAGRAARGDVQPRDGPGRRRRREQGRSMPTTRCRNWAPTTSPSAI